MVAATNALTGWRWQLWRQRTAANDAHYVCGRRPRELFGRATHPQVRV